MNAAARGNSFAYLAFVTVCVIWGTTYLGISVALESVPVLLVAGLRWMFAGVTLSVLMLVSGRGLPRVALWGPLLLLGFLMNVVGNGFVVYAQQYVASGLTAVLIATTPFWSALVERLLPNGERFSRQSLVGLALGFAGIVNLVWPEMSNGGASGRAFIGGVIAIQLACVGWVVGTSYAKRHELGDNPFRSAALQMVFSGTMLLGAATWNGDWARLSFTPRTLAAMLYLSIAGSLVAYSAYIYAIQHLPLSLVSLYAYINPIIAVTLGTLLLSEPFSTRIAISAALVLLGTWIVSTGKR
ncbi:MAG TPA: EamA family transporter [Vicinamibacterales bacterium]|nr:EamA family transporter [Vicinamibacterales bacterium]